jgi:hypothetical protein
MTLQQISPKIKKVCLVTLAALVLAGGGYATGRYVAPDKVVTKEKVVTQIQEKVVVQTKTEVQVVHDVAIQKDVHIVRVETKAKDGTTTVTTTEDDKSKTQAQTKANATNATQQVVTKIVYQDREVTKTVERLRPQWSVSLQPGFSLGTSQYNLLSALPVTHVMANVVVERRILGPVFMGVWGSSHADAGLSLRVEF